MAGPGGATSSTAARHDLSLGTINPTRTRPTPRTWQPVQDADGGAGRRDELGGRGARDAAAARSPEARAVKDQHAPVAARGRLHAESASPSETT